MSYNGSGTFNINTTGQPVVSGTIISSSVFNALTADLATGLSTAITKDGQTTITNNIPFNSYRITNLGAGVAGSDAARLSQVQAGSSSVVTVTGTDTYVGTMSPALAGYAAGNVFSFVVPNTNTTACTLNIDGLGAKAITRDGSTALIAGDLVAGKEVLVAYDGTRFQVLNSNSMTNLTVSGTATLSGGTANGIAYLNGSKVLTTGSGLTYNSTGNMTIAAPSSGTALALSNVAGSSALTTSDGTVASFLRSQTATSVDFGTTSAHALNLYTGFSNRVAISSTGNVTINAPTSGVALTVGGFSTSNVINVSTAVGATPIQVSDGTATSWWFTNGTNGIAFGTQTAHQLSLYTNNTAKVQISSAGNVTINAPTSGNTLNVGVLTGSTSIVVNGNLGSGSGLFVGNTSGTDGRAVVEYQSTLTTTKNYALGIDPDGGSSKRFALRDVTRGAISFEVGTSGNVTINAPTSGTALTVGGAAASGVVPIIGAVAPGDPFISARSTGTNVEYLCGTVGGTSGVFSGAFTNHAYSLRTNNTDRISISNGGTVTVNNPSSGYSLSVIGANGQTSTQTANTYGLSIGGATSTTDYSVLDFLAGASSPTLPKARIAVIAGGGGSTLSFGTSNSYTLGITNTAMTIGPGGNVTISAPSSGQALAMTGTAAGTAALTINTSATTGAQTASFSATNKPGAASGSPQKWIPIILDGTTYYVPAFN